MTRFSGFQNDEGVAILDTVTGELVFCPFDGGPPRCLREAVVPDPEAGVESIRGAHLPVATPRQTEPHPGEQREPRVRRPEESGAGFRPARRLARPRPMVIRYPSEDEVAARKAARLAGSPPTDALRVMRSPDPTPGEGDP